MVATVWGDGSPNQAVEIPPASIISEQAGNYLITEADAHKVIDYVGAGGDTFTLPAAVDVGNGFMVWIRHSGAGTLLIDPQGADTIATAVSLSMLQLQSVQLMVKGTDFGILVATGIGISAAGIPLAPVGTVAATNVQAAIAELDSEKVARAGDSMTGKLVLAAGADIASAATLDLTAATGNFVRVTGTAAISAVTMAAGQQCRIVADGALPLTYHSTNNKLNTGGLNAVLAAGYMVQYTCDLAGTVHGEIIKASGSAVISQVHFIQNQFFPTF